MSIPNIAELEKLWEVIKKWVGLYYVIIDKKYYDVIFENGSYNILNY